MLFVLNSEEVEEERCCVVGGGYLELWQEEGKLRRCEAGRETERQEESR